MADTEPQGVPEGAPEDQRNDEPRIPKSRLDQEVAKRKSAEQRWKELEAEWKELEAEIQSLRESSEPAPAAPAPETATVPGQSEDEMKAIQERLSAFEDREARRELAQRLDLTAEQATEVQKILKSAPGLEPTEALSIARGRDAELFGSTDQRGYNPAQHSSLRPSGGGPPPAETEREKLEAIRNIPDAYARRQAHSKVLGKRLAETSGWQYKDGSD